MILTPWYDIYKHRLNAKYFSHIKKKYGVFIDHVEEAIKADPHYDRGGLIHVAEIGCGAGNITKALLERVGEHVSHECVDIDTKMLGLAVSNIGPNKKVTYAVSDVTDMPRVTWDIVHSHGVLEHFTDEQINNIMTSQLAKHIHFVPGANYVTPSRGDERLMTPDQWKDIYPWDEVIEFNSGFDLILMKNV